MIVMPFGLCNAQATFQRVMDRALANTPHCESYVDDILVFSPTFDAHPNDLRVVFERFEVAGLHLCREMCKLGFRSIEFLGHQISFEGNSPALEYTHKLESFPQPRNTTELQRFLGTANYYRCYIEDMASIAAPLYDRRKGGKHWSWDDDVSESIRGTTYTAY